jgi:hypothetical protein
MLSRLACVLVACASIAAGKPATGPETLSGKGPLTADAVLVLVRPLLPKADAALGREVTLVSTVEGKFVAIQDNRVSIVAPAIAVLVNVIEKKVDLGITRWTPHIFIVKGKSDQLELVTHLEPPDLVLDVDAATDKGSKLTLSILPVAKEGGALVATLRKADGNDSGGNIDETTVIYLLQRDVLTIAFSTKTEVTSSEKSGGVMTTEKELNKIELGKKGNKVLDLMVTTKKYEIKGDDTEEYKPLTERWCWNDKATSYMPECK